MRRQRTPGTAPGRAAIVSTLVLVGIYLLVAVAATAFAGSRPPVQQLERRLRATRQTCLRLERARQVADHRRAHFSLGVDPDDDPADRTDRPLDGALRRDPDSIRGDPPPLPQPQRGNAGDGRDFGRLVRRDDDRLQERAQRLDPRARAGDRVLLRPHRVRLRDLLPPRAASRARATSSSSACSRPPAG